MDAETLLLMFVGVTAVALALQAFFAWRLTTSTRRLVDQVSKASAELEGEARLIVAQLQEVSTSLENVRNVSESLGEQASEVSSMFGSRATEIDQLLNQLVDLGSKQAEKVDGVVTDTVKKFEQTTTVIQQDLLRPVVEISSLIKGLGKGLSYLFSKQSEGSPEEESSEEELFI